MAALGPEVRRYRVPRTGAGAGVAAMLKTPLTNEEHRGDQIGIDVVTLDTILLRGAHSSHEPPFDKRVNEFQYRPQSNLLHNQCLEEMVVP